MILRINSVSAHMICKGKKWKMVRLRQSLEIETGPLKKCETQSGKYATNRLIKILFHKSIILIMVND